MIFHIWKNRYKCKKVMQIVCLKYFQMISISSKKSANNNTIQVLCLKISSTIWLILPKLKITSSVWTKSTMISLRQCMKLLKLWSFKRIKNKLNLRLKLINIQILACWQIFMVIKQGWSRYWLTSSPIRSNLLLCKAKSQSK